MKIRSGRRTLYQSLLRAGAQVFIITRQAADGSLTAQRIQAGEHGMKPPM